MVNCNPETVSTDYDTADRLYFEPLTFEDVLEVVEAERRPARWPGSSAPSAGRPAGPGAAAQGRRRPRARHLARGHRRRGAPWGLLAVLADTGLGPQARHGDDVRRGARDRGDHRLPRCWSGRPTCSAAEVWRSSTTTATLEAYIAKATDLSAAHPVLVDRFLEDAVEIDVDALFDGTDLYLGGVMEHIEEAGIHSGDSACALPPITLGSADLLKIRGGDEAGRPHRRARADERPVRDQGRHPLRDRGQPAGQPHGAVRLQGDGGAAGQGRGPDRGGESIADLRAAGVLPATGDGTDLPEDAPIAVKEAVLPFHRFRTVDGHGVDTVLSPEMKSTGEVMGLDSEFGRAFAKSAGRRLRLAAHRGHGLRLAGQPGQALGDLPGQAAGRPRLPRAGDGGHRPGAAAQRGALRGGRQVQRRPRQRGGEDPGRGRRHRRQHALRLAGNSGPRLDGYEIRTAAVAAGIPCITTVQGMAAAVQGSRRCAGARSASAACRRCTRRCGRRGKGRRALDDCRPRRRAPAGAAGRRGGRPRPVDAYVELTLAAPKIAERAEPGQFVAFAIGGRPRRCWSLDRDRRRATACLQSWWRPRQVDLAGRAGAGSRVDVVGPLGRRSRPAGSPVPAGRRWLGAAPLCPGRPLPGGGSRSTARRRGASTTGSARWRALRARR